MVDSKPRTEREMAELVESPIASGVFCLERLDQWAGVVIFGVGEHEPDRPLLVVEHTPHVVGGELAPLDPHALHSYTIEDRHGRLNRDWLAGRLKAGAACPDHSLKSHLVELQAI